MKRALFVTVVLAVFASGLLAQSNPFVGTWKLNLAKSSLDPFYSASTADFII